MKLLLDENIPIKLKYRLIEAGLNCFTVKDMQWLGKQNGELLQLMLSNEFTTFITIDNNLSTQTNFQNYPVKVIVMVAFDNTYETIMEFLPEVITKIKEEFVGASSVVHPSVLKLK